MPDPTAHADDMTPPAEYVPPTVKDNETLPPLWWFNPWNTVLGLLHKVDHLKSTSRGEQAARIGQQNRADTLEKNNRGLAVENGELRGEIAGLNEARKADEASYAHVCEQRNAAERLANYHQTERNAFLRKVELTLKPKCPHLYDDTIGYVQWAADEIKALRATLSVMTEDRDAYIEKLDRERGTHEATMGYVRQLEEKVNHLEAKWPRDLWNGGKIYGDVYTCQPHSKTHSETKAGLNPAKLAKENQSLRERLADEKQAVRNLRKYLAKESRLLRKEQAKVNKLEDKLRKQAEERIFAKANAKKPAKYGDARDKYSAIARRHLKHLALRQARAEAVAKAKKKGGAK